MMNGNRQTATVDAARDVIQTQNKPQGTNGGMKNVRKSFKAKTKQGKNGCKGRQE